MMGYEVPRKVEVPVRQITEGIKVVTGEPYMNTDDVSNQYTYIPTGYRIYYHTGTQEVRYREVS